MQLQRRKIIYVAAAPPGEAAADLCRLGLLAEDDSRRDSLRVVVPRRQAAELQSRASLPGHVLLGYHPVSAAWLWARLMVFLGLCRDNEIVVCSHPGQSRGLKLLALALRGRVGFSAGQGPCVPFSLGAVLQAAWRQRFAARGPICLVGSTSPDALRKILSDIRKRYPGAPVHGVLPASLAESIHGLDSLEVVSHGLRTYFRLLPRCLGPVRFRHIILPWTNERFTALRWAAWMLPLWRLEICNENLDAFPGRRPAHLLRHGLWRLRKHAERSRQRRQRRRREKVEYHRSLPVGVIGSASTFYLQAILLDLRKRYSGVQVHAILPPSLEVPADGMFDRITVLRGGFFAAWAQAWRFVARTKHQAWIVPCTNESYSRMKVLAFLLPLRSRQIYNELADRFAARELRTFYGHCLWRLRDQLCYQIIAGAVGSNWFARWTQLFLYSGRLLAGAAALWRVRLHSGRAIQTAIPAPRIGLLLQNRNGDGRDLLDSDRTLPAAPSMGSVDVAQVPVKGSFRKLHDAIRSAFDDRTAQVPGSDGPQG